jgi:Asp-tRNA(Asn)/Glu-tRNA(Gln) amidotransferase A subunit family amidase
MRAVLKAAAPTVRTGPARRFSLRGIQLWIPDELGDWPSFANDVAPALAKAFGEPRSDHGLPGTTRVRNIYSSVWCSHLDDLVSADTLGFFEALGAVVSAIVLRGRFGDRRIHPATAELLALILLGHYTLYRDPKKAIANAEEFRRRVGALWDRGDLIAMPVCMWGAPKIGRTNYNPHLLSCTCPGNLADATGLAIPFGRFGNGLPRAIQLLGPPGSEDLLIDLAERLEATPPR